MIKLLFLTLALAISAYSQSCLDPNITWVGGENLAWWNQAQKNLWNELPPARAVMPKTSNRATRIAIYENYAFLAFPRWLEGRSFGPITLAQMSLDGSEHIQYPFPSLAMQKLGDCSALQNVVDIFLDRRGILWVLDAGTESYFGDICGPKVFTFDPKTKTVCVCVDGMKDLIMYYAVHPP